MYGERKGSSEATNVFSCTDHAVNKNAQKYISSSHILSEVTRVVRLPLRSISGGCSGWP